MKTDKNIPTFEMHNDAALVSASLEGDHQAFGKIVARYQRLLCSKAYASLGNLGASEDVAQEAFIEAWKKLGSLKEPNKLKSWLCGILRFKVSHYVRKESRQPTRGADDIHEGDLESNDEPIETSAMKEEEQAMLWQALEAVPETYRETLILYYREHRSIEHVAYELDLTEDAVKQRLSRGRKLLQQKMMAFVEGALERSTPTHVFTAGVMAALVTIAPEAKAAGAGMAAAKVGSAFKWATIVTFIATVSGLISSIFALRANFDQSRTKRERTAIVKAVILFLGLAGVLVAGLLSLKALALGGFWNAGYITILSQVFVAAFVVAYTALTFKLLNQMGELRTAERLRKPEMFTADVDQPGSKKRDYKSRLTLFGVPLLHVKLAMQEQDEGPAIGWIAAGHKAYGLLFAWGGIAVAPVSVGIITGGIISIGVVSVGLIGLGTVGIGLLGIGAVGIGYKAYSSLSSLGWESALSGGFAVAKEAAIGHIAYAKEVNNELAASIANLSTVNQTYAIVLGIMALLVLVPVVLWSNAVRKKMRVTRS